MEEFCLWLLSEGIRHQAEWKETEPQKHTYDKAKEMHFKFK